MLVKSIWLHMIVMNVTKGRTLKTSLTMVYSLSFRGGLAQTAPSPASASTLTDHTPDYQEVLLKCILTLWVYLADNL